MLDFSFYIDKGWLDLMLMASYFSVPINTIYCLVMIFKKKENLKTAITSSLIGVATSLTAGVFVFFWLANLLGAILG